MHSWREQLCFLGSHWAFYPAACWIFRVLFGSGLSCLMSRFQLSRFQEWKGSFLCCLFLKQCSSVYFNLALSFLCNPGWSLTQGSSSVSASQGKECPARKGRFGGVTFLFEKLALLIPNHSSLVETQSTWPYVLARQVEKHYHI